MQITTVICGSKCMSMLKITASFEPSSHDALQLQLHFPYANTLCDDGLIQFDDTGITF